MNSPLRRGVVSLAAMLLIFLPLVTASAQPTSTDRVFTAQIADIDVVLKDPGGLVFYPGQYEFAVDDPYQEEYIWVLAESTYTTYELILVDTPSDAQGYMEATIPNLEAFYSSWEILDQSIGVDTTWFLGEADMDGRLILVYFEYQVGVFGDIDLAYMQFSTKTDFISDMLRAQRELTVGGLSVPLNPDKSAISDIVGMPFQYATPVADEADRWLERGLDGDASWTSPTFGTSVEWDASLWRFPFSYDFAIFSSPEGWDVLTLLTIDGRGYVSIYVDTSGDDTPDTVLAEWQFDEYPVSLESDFVILDAARSETSASVVYTTVNAENREVVVIIDISFQDDGTMIYTELTTSPEAIATAYANYANGVRVNGGLLDLTWDVEYIEALVP